VRSNPFADGLKLLTQPQWTTPVFWLLLVAGVVIAAINWWGDREQRTGIHVWNWIVRFTMGAMWWGQTLWKLPPSFGGLRFWMDEMVKYAAYPAQRAFVKDVVEAHFSFFAPQIYCAEVLIATTLILGLFTRLGAVLGLLASVNLWFGLYRHPTEWPWTYGFMILLHITLLVYRMGRSLGVDAIFVRRLKPPSRRDAWGRLVALLC
jgi:uncharacterized membrane protein YphA (DoxX/SURF4 family)